MTILIRPNGELYDDQAEWLAEVAQFVDTKLSTIETQVGYPELADYLDVWSFWDHVAGLGFVACQQYLSVVCSDVRSREGAQRPPREQGRKSDLLKKGPRAGHSDPANRYGIAEVVHAAANYWKHRGEWRVVIQEDGLRVDEEGANRVTLDVLRGIGVDVNGDYVLADVMRRLRGDFPKRFTSIIPALVAWRDAVFLDGESGPGST